MLEGLKVNWGRGRGLLTVLACTLTPERERAVLLWEKAADALCQKSTPMHLLPSPPLHLQTEGRKGGTDGH
jgi:hypothetical protein